MKKRDHIEVIGVMSGTSLDGLDMAWCSFSRKNPAEYQLNAAKTLAFSDNMKSRLANATSIGTEELCKLDADLGLWMGEQLKAFMTDIPDTIDTIASHGHTIFHQPAKGFTLQIGNAAHIYAQTGIPVISDFRSLDVALGGQGAPLVPVGDRMLFGMYDFCLNLGGIANISFEEGNDRIAYDICACNMLLNTIAKRLGREYDENGDLARSGQLIPELLDTLNSWAYLKHDPPKSLGFEDINADLFPLLNNGDPKDILHTLVRHISMQISAVCTPVNASGSMLITGGGAHNTFLRECLSEDLAGMELVYPDRDLVDFKEAVIFALMGALRVLGLPNVLHSVTGAERDQCAGQVLGNVIAHR